MSQTSTERLNGYLAQLPPQAQALLMRAFESAIERGEDAAVAHLVLGELRKIVRGSDEKLGPRANDPSRLLFRPLQPFLAESQSPLTPLGLGQVNRNALALVWNWLARDGAPEAVREFTSALANAASSAQTSSLVRAFQLAVANAIKASGADPKAPPSRTVPFSVQEEMRTIAAVLEHAETLDALAAALPERFRAFSGSQVVSAGVALGAPALHQPQIAPFALRLVMQRLPAFWQIIRLAIHAAASDDASRVAAHPFGSAVTMVIAELSVNAAQLRSDMKRGQLASVCDRLKIVHDGVRGLRTELDIRNDSDWGKQLAALRVDLSATLKIEIDNVPGRVRRLLRQRPDREVSAATRLDAAEIDETAALVGFVAVCRSYASELAINEVTLRAYSDLQSYVEQSTETLVASLRQCDPRLRGFRQQQVAAAVRFCDVLFGRDYAVLMSRAADNALADERKAARAVN